MKRRRRRQEHRGGPNTRVVLDWVFENFEAPEQIFVTGCSAGSVGSSLWAAHVMQHYSDTDVIQFGDSFVGSVTDAFFNEGFSFWNAESSYPDWIADFNPQSIDDVYIDIANFYPEQFFSEYSSVSDSAQLYYFQLMGGGDAQMWLNAMRASIESIEDKTENFAAFVPEESPHCILYREDFYTITAKETRLLDWLEELLQKGEIESVKDEALETDQ